MIRLFATMLASFSQFERELIQERIKSGMASAKTKWKAVGRTKGDFFKTKNIALKVSEDLKKSLSIRKTAAKYKVNKSTMTISKKYRDNFSFFFTVIKYMLWALSYYEEPILMIKKYRSSFYFFVFLTVFFVNTFSFAGDRVSAIKIKAYNPLSELEGAHTDGVAPVPPPGLGQYSDHFSFNRTTEYLSDEEAGTLATDYAGETNQTHGGYLKKVVDYKTKHFSEGGDTPNVLLARMSVKAHVSYAEVVNQEATRECFLGIFLSGDEDHEWGSVEKLLGVDDELPNPLKVALATKRLEELSDGIRGHIKSYSTVVASSDVFADFPPINEILNHRVYKKPLFEVAGGKIVPTSNFKFMEKLDLLRKAWI